MTRGWFLVLVLFLLASDASPNTIGHRRHLRARTVQDKGTLEKLEPRVTYIEEYLHLFPPAECASKGGRVIDNECFSVHIGQNNVCTYQDCKTFCEKRGGFLAEPSNLQRLISEAPTVWHDLPRNEDWYMWVGALQGSRGAWKWPHSEKSLYLSDTNWAVGEPSKDGNCAALFWASLADQNFGIGRLRASTCVRKINPLCQYSITNYIYFD